MDDLFHWAEERNGLIAHKDTSEAVSYLVNQKAYLVQFLEDGRIPLDNNDAERSIRSFCVGRHSWHCISTSRGAATSAMLYSLAETAKANHLKPQEYFEYVLEQMLEHEGNVTDELVNSLLPWSESLPEKVRKKTPGKDK